MKITLKPSKNKLGGTSALLAKGGRGKAGPHAGASRDAVRWAEAEEEIAEVLEELRNKEAKREE